MKMFLNKLTIKLILYYEYEKYLATSNSDVISILLLYITGMWNQTKTNFRIKVEFFKLSLIYITAGEKRLTDVGRDYCLLVLYKRSFIIEYWEPLMTFLFVIFHPIIIHI